MRSYERPENFPRPGQFKVDGRKVFGELTVDGRKTSILLRDDEYFSIGDVAGECILGELHDLTRVTLLNCIPTIGTGSTTRDDRRYSFAELFPHFVLVGDAYLDPNERLISALEFTVDDATNLFYDFDAFGHLINPKKYIKVLVRAQEDAIGRKIDIGPHPEIQYFTGRDQIFSSDTLLGKVSARHNIHYKLPGSHGLRLDDTIVVRVEPKTSVNFNSAMEYVLILSRYFGLIAGRPQNIQHLLVQQDPQHAPLRVHWSLLPERETAYETRTPHVADILLDAVQHPDAFSDVLARWLAHSEERKAARGRFFDCFAKQSYFDYDRMIGAANMFDLLPVSAVPVDFPMAPEVERARKAARDLFLPLPDSPERHGVLSELGRMGKGKLKHKVRYRAEIVYRELPNAFPELFKVTDQAVNCRNYYVHGGSKEFDYDGNVQTTNFLEQTLEFVFAASELIEAGWNIAQWRARGSVLAHPFATYCYSYKENLAKLNELLDR